MLNRTSQNPRPLKGSRRLTLRLPLLAKRRGRGFYFWLIVLLAALLPFELRQPLLTLGPLSITNVEAALYLTLLVWLISVLVNRRITFTPLHAAVLLLAAAMTLAAIFAPLERVAAWKFTLRSLGGMALFFAVADGVRSPAQRRWVVIALVVGALVSAIIGLAEAWWPASWPLLTLFKTRIFNVGGFVRAGGTFEYPNTSAMYWEAVLPLGVGIVVMGRANKPGFAPRKAFEKPGLFALGNLLSILLTLVFIQAIIFSASRAALFVAVLALVVLMGLTWRNMRDVRIFVLANLIAALVVIGINLIANPLMALRLQSETNDSWFRAQIVADTRPITLAAGQAMTQTVQLRNTSIVAWQMDGAQPVRLSYHWVDATTNTTVVLNGWRTDLPADLQPDETVQLDARVIAPPQAGKYVLQWDVLQEHVSWFSTYNNPTANVSVAVTPSAVQPKAGDMAQPIVRTARVEPTRRELWSAALQIWLQHPVFGAGPDNFRHIYGSYLKLNLFNTNIHTNNWYIETLTNWGLVGAVALLTLLVAMARTAYWAVKVSQVDLSTSTNVCALPSTTRIGMRSAQDALREEKNIATNLLVLSCWVALFAFCAHGLLDYFFEFTPTYGLFWLLLGLVAAQKPT